MARAAGRPDLERGLPPGVGVLHWARSLDRDEADALAHWAAGPAVRAQAVARAERSLEAGLRVADSAPEGPARDRLRADLAWLAPAMARQLRSGVVRVAVRTIDHDACHRFHCDWLEVRAIVTYVGPGTEWTTETPVPGDPAWSPRTLHRASAGDVLLLAGRGEPGRTPASEPGVWHRSPPIQGTSVRRLVLTVDDLVDVGERSSPGDLGGHGRP